MLVLAASVPAQLPAQLPAQTTAARATAAAPSRSTIDATPPGYWRKLAAGFATSILAHEAGHIITAYAVGSHPTFGFDRGRPTVYSNIDPIADPNGQLLFSSAGLVVQTVMDEAILDIPHAGRGAPFERGILAGGLSTAWFYATVGRNARVSDITWIARTSSLSRGQAALIYAGIATVQALRIAHDGHYANFFAQPEPLPGGRAGLRVGVAILPAPAAPSGGSQP